MIQIYKFRVFEALKFLCLGSGGEAERTLTTQTHTHTLNFKSKVIDVIENQHKSKTLISFLNFYGTACLSW